MIEFITATKKDFKWLEQTASKIWHETFDPIIGEKQVSYMLSRFQCEEAFARQTQKEGYTYHLICDDKEKLGYIALCDDGGEKLFMSKLYLLPSARGKGLGKTALSFATATAKAKGKTAVYLTVNKQNARAVAVYEKCGFTRIDSVISDIGNGFYMDDFVYEKKI